MERLIIPQRLKEFFLQQDHAPIRRIIVEDSGNEKFLFTLRGVELYPVSSFHLMSEGEALCDKDGLTCGKLPEDGLRISSGETNDLHIEKDLSIHRGDQSGLASIFSLQGPEGIHGFDSGERRQRPGDLEREEGRVTRNGIGARKDEHIAIDRLLHPEVNRLAETEDHDGDADEHGEGGHQCSDGDHGPCHGVVDVSARQFSFRSKQEAEKRSDEAVKEMSDRGNEKRDSDEDEKGGQESEDGPVIDGLLEGKDERKDENPDTDKAKISKAHLYFRFKGPQRQGLLRCNLGGLSCRADRRENRGKHSQPKPRQ